jgi:hypothetical protein
MKGKKTTRGASEHMNGVRSPMFAPNHGLVGKNHGKIPYGTHNATQSSMKMPTTIKSPQKKSDIV